MSFTQYVRVRSGDTNLDMCSSQTSGTLSFAGNTARTGDITIGNAAQTASTLTSTTGAVDITATTGDATFGTTGAGSTVYLGEVAADVATRVGQGVASEVIVVGSSQTSGLLALGINASRTGNIDIGAATGTHLTRIRGGDVEVSTITDVDVTAGAALEMTSGTTALVTGGTGLTLTATTGALDMNATAGAVTLDSDTTTTLTAGTTALVTGGTGLTLTATTGALDMNATAGAATLDSGTTTTLTAGTTMDVIATAGDMNINTTGTVASARDIYVEAKGAGSTTYLGATTVDTTTRLHNGGTTATCVVASAQTSGLLAIGINSARTGNIDIGSATGTHVTRVRGGGYVMDMSASVSVDCNNYTLTPVGATVLDSTGNVTMTSDGDFNIQAVEMTPSGVTAWTPTIGSATVDFTTSAASGEYYRWGNMITYTWSVVWTGQNSATGTLLIKGLPFDAVLENVMGVITNKDWISGNPSGTNIVPLSQAGETFMNFRQDTNTISISGVDATGLMSGSITMPVV
jgi:hypothetical protein